MIVILFTQSYPYDAAAEHTFLRPELRRLSERFEKIIVVPRLNTGSLLAHPSYVMVNVQYADFLQRNPLPHKILEMTRSLRRILREIRIRPAVLLSPTKILKLFLFTTRAELTRRWVTDFIRKQVIDVDNCLLYSYWFDHMATGLGMAKQDFPTIRLISRAHGYDIYEEHYYPYYWPYRHATFKTLDRLFFASDAGRIYLSKRYPEYASKFETAHLGIEDPGFATRPSADGIFRIISCANIVPVKRLGLLLEGIATAACLRPKQRFQWIHFGDGPGRLALLRHVSRKFPSNAQGQLLGNVPNAEIMQYYKEQPVDVFVNVSSTEGVPVAIQEAISCGIPVVATSVGGNPEIVSRKNGILLGSDPRPQEIAAALLKIWDNPELAAQMRIESRRLWERSYNAEVNFRAFAERLHAIRER